MDEYTQLRAEYDALVHAIAHDLRAPLRSITGFSAVLRDEYAGKLGGDGERYLQHVTDGAVMLNGALDGLIEISRVGLAPLARTEVDLVPLVREFVDVLHAREPRRKVDLQTPERLVIAADRLLIRLLLRHLVGNAWKFTAPRSLAEIKLSVDGSESTPRVVLADNGVGFDPSLATRLFQPFVRLHGEAFAGPGLGLAAVRRIIERHGGWIEVDSQQDQGTTVRFSLG